MNFSLIKGTCTTKSGENGCRVTNLPKINITNSNYEFDFWATDSACKRKLHHLQQTAFILKIMLTILFV